MKKTIQEWIKDGAEIKITHWRRGWAVHKQCKNKFNIDGSRQYGIVQCLDHNKLQLEHNIPGFARLPTGGETEVEISHKQKRYLAKFRFNNNQPYNKKIGVDGAVSSLVECSGS